VQNVKQERWKRAYKAGQTGYILGEFEDSNPYGKDNLFLHCAWFVGFCDQHSETAGRGAPLPRREDDAGYLRTDAKTA